MGEKTAGVGHFQIPTAPAALTAVAQSATANTLGSAVSFGNAPSALYITGVTIGVATTQTPTYVQIQILVAASVVASVLVPYGVSSATAASVVTGYRAIYPPIPVANAAAITVKSASSVASAVAWGVSLECIATTSVVDDGVAQTSNVTQWNSIAVATPATAGIPDVNVKNINNVAAATPGAAGGLFIAGTNAATTVTTSFTTTFTGNLTGSVASVTGAVGSVTGAVGSVTGLTASNLDAAVSSRMATYTQPTGFLAATFPTGTVANTTNITAGTITTATNLTNAATAGDLTATMKTSVTTAATAATPTAAAVTGAVGSVTAAVTLPSIPANWITAAGITAAALNGKGDWNIGKTGYALTAAYDLAKTASQAGDAMALTAAERAAVADALLSRNVSGGSSAGRLVKEALAVLRNKVEVVAGTLTVYDTDDTTVLFTAAVTTAAGNPVSSIDPA